MKEIRKLYFLTAIVFILFLAGISLKQTEPAENDRFISPMMIPIREEAQKTKIPMEFYDLEAVDEGQVIYHTRGGTGYRYGPSIIEYEDGSMDAWFSSPGNNSTEWDWITWRHCDEEGNWLEEQTVLKPTPGSPDQCSVCDPAVIRFVRDYRALFQTEPDNFAFHGYDTMTYFVTACDDFGRNWQQKLDEHRHRGLQTNFKFYWTPDTVGDVNAGIRRVVYSHGFKVEVLK